MQNSEEKLIKVFDFDKTLTDKDSFFFFVCYILIKKKKIIYIPIIILLAVLHKCKLINNTKFKDYCIRMSLKYDNKNIIKKNSILFANSNIIKLNEIYKNLAVEPNSKIIISSASLEIYLREFVSNEFIVIGSELEFDMNGNCIGLKNNNHGNKKKENLSKIGIDYIHEFYTDSKDDIPLMQISNKTFIVKRGVIKTKK